MTHAVDMLLKLGVDLLITGSELAASLEDALRLRGIAVLKLVNPDYLNDFKSHCSLLAAPSINSLSSGFVFQIRKP